ncbi:hypothetical protein, partial [Thiolapillus sp.]|uniref:hypothetical protein n=1 Tax=Thiolapillus sp. TaxID=2017437 RepID=UPI0025D778E0
QSINLLIHPDKYSMSCRLQRLLPSHVGKMRVLTFWNHGFRRYSAARYNRQTADGFRVLLLRKPWRDFFNIPLQGEFRWES